MFTREEPLVDITEFDYFRDSYDKLKPESEYWVLHQLKNKKEKSEEISEKLRLKGNAHFQRKEYSDCRHYYTKSLCYASRNGVSYGLALANRSAALYYIGDFENCLKDIEFCLKSEYPKRLYPKVLLRKCYCLYRLKGENCDELKDCIESALSFVKNCDEFSTKERDAHEKQFKNLDFATVPTIPPILNINDIEIPAITNGENKNFAFASSSVGIRYDVTKGRHVVATENIKRGDVLFVEKAFFVAPTFKKKSVRQPANKCYHCLRDARACIPCPACTLCVFCDEDCFINGWRTFHKYECLGMQSNIWYELGAAYPAFRALCRGIPSKFAAVKSDEIAQFGSKQDNYPYFNSLLSHWNYSKILDSSCKLVSRTIAYLKQCTTFFEDIPPEVDINYIGGLFMRHLLQIVCNASLIQHWDFNNICETIPKDLTTDVACGMFPSISLMNHSCLSNINIIYVGDTAIVKALRDINKDEEVFNCYGLDYGPMNVKDKVKVCKERYNFKCDCALCAGTTADHVDMALYKCPHCEFRYDDSLDKVKNCISCHESLSDFIRLQAEALYPLFEMDDLDKELRLDVILKCQKSGLTIFTKLHPFYAKLYEAFWKYYIQAGDFENAIKYIKLLVEEQTTIVSDPRRAGVLVFYALKQVYTYAKKEKIDLMSIEDEINLLRQQCVNVLQIFYPFSQSAIYRCMTT